jgi:hypothetical protein
MSSDSTGEIFVIGGTSLKKSRSYVNADFKDQIVYLSLVQTFIWNIEIFAFGLVLNESLRLHKYWLVKVSEKVAAGPGRLDYQSFHVWLEAIENTVRVSSNEQRDPDLMLNSMLIWMDSFGEKRN